MKFVDIDDSAELTIRCKADRNFDLTINLNRDLTGKSHKLQVSDGTTTILSFAPSDGLQTLSTSVKLSKIATDMAVQTGYFRYDLIEIDGDNVDNIFHGWFAIEPSVTSL